MLYFAFIITAAVSSTLTSENARDQVTQRITKDLICAAVLSGRPKNDLEVSLLKELNLRNVNIDDLYEPKTRSECLFHAFYDNNLKKSKIYGNENLKYKLPDVPETTTINGGKQYRQHPALYSVTNKTSATDLMIPSKTVSIQSNVTNSIEIQGPVTTEPSSHHNISTIKEIENITPNNEMLQQDDSTPQWVTNTDLTKSNLENFNSNMNYHLNLFPMAIVKQTYTPPYRKSQSKTVNVATNSKVFSNLQIKSTQNKSHDQTDKTINLNSDRIYPWSSDVMEKMSETVKEIVLKDLSTEKSKITTLDRNINKESTTTTVTNTAPTSKGVTKTTFVLDLDRIREAAKEIESFIAFINEMKTTKNNIEREVSPTTARIIQSPTDLFPPLAIVGNMNVIKTYPLDTNQKNQTKLVHHSNVPDILKTPLMHHSSQNKPLVIQSDLYQLPPIPVLIQNPKNVIQDIMVTKQLSPYITQNDNKPWRNPNKKNNNGTNRLRQNSRLPQQQYKSHVNVNVDCPIHSPSEIDTIGAQLSEFNERFRNLAYNVQNKLKTEPIIQNKFSNKCNLREDARQKITRDNQFDKFISKANKLDSSQKEFLPQAFEADANSRNKQNKTVNTLSDKHNAFNGHIHHSGNTRVRTAPNKSQHQNYTDNKGRVVLQPIRQNHDTNNSREISDKPISRENHDSNQQLHSDIRGFHKVLERYYDYDKPRPDKSINNRNIPITQPQPLKLDAESVERYDNTYFQALMESQQRMNDMLGQILGTNHDDIM